LLSVSQTDQGTLRVLEWAELCERIASLAHTPWGREASLDIVPLEDPAAWREALARVTELLDLLRTNRSVPLRRAEAIEPQLAAAAVEGAHLDGPDLLQAADFFALVHELSRFSHGLDDSHSRLREDLGQLLPAEEFRRSVEQSIEPDGELKDSASPALRRLRRSIASLQTNILQRLQRLADQLGGDSVVTIREGRHVVSVTEHDRSKVKGVVHDRSQSGATYFVEPMAILELGNDLRSAEVELRAEILRILTELTSLLRLSIDAARQDIEVIRAMDRLWATARWGHRHGACVPELAADPVLSLASVRHPLLLAQRLESEQSLAAAREAVRPFSLELTDQTRAIIISGPNTGGKTVCLKSVGLTVLMIQAGIPVTVDPESKIGDLDAVFADIGDEQSLALSLSTFSAHLRRVGAACRDATGRSLVLLDELGVGTDPEEGGALARAVILTLVERGTRLLVTTHYNTLKLLTEDHAAIENAAYLFDEANLAPTYELVVGHPGASYALEIAERLHFPPGVLTRAQGGLGEKSQRLSQLLARLTEREARLVKAEEKAREAQARLEALLEYNRQAEARWDRLSKTAEAEARRQAREIVDTTRKETEKLVADIRRSRADRGVIKEAHHRLSRLSEAARDLPAPPGADDLELKVGLRVQVKGLARPGEITQVHKDGGRVTVLIGSMHYTVDRTDVQSVVPQAQPEQPREKVPDQVVPAGEVYEIDLRGRTVDEAKLELADTLELIREQGILNARVIHGRGTGVLRRELTGWFRAHAAVASFRLGGPGEGGDGVTVITLKAP
jgi:DNA mismatch repair protein MutS2